MTAIGFESHDHAHCIDDALRVWPELDPYRERLVAAWSSEGGTLTFGNVSLTVMIGDARETLPKWQGKADAWFLDGFSPAKNPELWSAELMQAVGDHTRAGAADLGGPQPFGKAHRAVAGR